MTRQKALVVTIVVTTEKGGRCEIKCLIDSGAECNFVSQSWIISNDLPVAFEPKSVKAVDGRTVRSYGTHKLDVTVEDNNQVRNREMSKFHAVDMMGYDMILGYPWLCEVDPDIRWSEGTFTFRAKRPLFDMSSEGADMICDVEEFAQLASLAIQGKGGAAFIALPYNMLPHSGSTVQDLASDDTAMVGGLQKADGHSSSEQTASPYPSGPHSGRTVQDLASDDAAMVGALQEVDDQRIPEQVEDLQETFSEELSDSLNTHDQVEHAIDLVPGSQPKPGPIYNMSQDELATIRDYLASATEKGWIRPSTSPAGSPVLFVRKSDGSLRLCVDYRGLNEITIKNKYPLPLLSEMLDRFAHARHFTKLDIRNAYHRIRIRKGDEWKTAFRTRYGQFEYQVMPFGLVNAPATFQGYVNDALRPFLDDFCTVYLDDVLIYSETEEEHWEHVRKVLKALLHHRLYAKLSKCAFNRKEVRFLGFIVGQNGIQMEPERITAITEWRAPQCAQDVLVFLGFAGFYRRFIMGFSQIAAPLTDLTKGVKKGEYRKKFEWTAEAQRAFDELKRAFTTAPVLQHFDPNAKLRMETDASKAGAGGILSQWCEADQQWHPIAFISYKFKGAEVNWDTHDKELYAIVLGFKQWRHYLQGAREPICVVTDHNNLKYFMTTKELNPRQVRWAEKLSAFDFHILYRKGKLNPADGPSRRPDLFAPEGSESNNDEFLPTLQNKLRTGSIGYVDSGVPASVKLFAATTTPCEAMTPVNVKYGTSRLMAQTALSEEESYLDMPMPMTAWLLQLQRNDGFASGGWRNKIDKKKAEYSFWHVGKDGLLRRKGAVFVPDDKASKEEILRSNHDSPHAGHFGKKRTSEAIRTKYYWHKMDHDIEDYVRTCPDCQRVRVHRHKPYGRLNPIPPGNEKPFHTVTMDFITDMPPAKDPYTGKTYDAVLVLVCKLSKFARYIPTTKNLDAEGLADVLWREHICQEGMMRSIISDRGSLFTSRFWTNLCWHLGAKRKLSTAFHPQSDGQTERQNQTLEHYLRVYSNYRQDNWPEILPMAAFAYNNGIHSAIGTTPNFAVKGFYADFADAPEGVGIRGEAPSATERAEWLRQTRNDLLLLWKNVAEQQAKYYDSRHKAMVFQKGDKVLLRNVNIRTLRPKKKIDHRQLGPFTILDTVGSQAYRLELPKSYGKLHPTFHVSLLEPWHSRGTDPQPQPIDVDGEEEWEVEEILDMRGTKQDIQYLVKWMDSPSHENSWEPSENLANAQKAIDAFFNTRQLRNPDMTALPGKKSGRGRSRKN